MTHIVQDPLIPQIEDALREINHRLFGEKPPRDGYFNAVFRTLEDTGGSQEKLEELGFPEISPSEFRTLIERLEADGIDGITDQEYLTFMAKKFTSWLDRLQLRDGSNNAGKLGNYATRSVR